MLHPIKVVDVELSQPIATLEELDGYRFVQGLVRLHGVPIGYVKAPIAVNRCEASTIAQLVLKQHQQKIIRQLLVNGLATGHSELGLKDLLKIAPLQPGELPLVTVAVCTRNRTFDLEVCLNALLKLDYLKLDLLVIDNAPDSDATKQLVQQYSQVRYVCESRPGLDWARNRAILEAQGEIIAYTDDDVAVDAGWVKAIATVFAENPEVMAVTGLVVPYELETEAQILFEMNGGFGRGFQRQWWRFGDRPVHWTYLGTGNVGTGANMAYRRCLFQKIGGFDPALDVGTATNGAGDLEMFFRVLKEGHTLVYEPGAIVRHRHRREYQQLRSQLAHNGSVYAAFIRSSIAYPDTKLGFIRLGLSWLWSGHLRPLGTSFFSPNHFPRDLIWVQLLGIFASLNTYFQARKNAAQIVETFGDISGLPSSPIPTPDPAFSERIAVRSVEISNPLTALTDVMDVGRVRVFVLRDGSPLGSVDISNDYQSVSVARLVEAIVETLEPQLLKQQTPLEGLLSPSLQPAAPQLPAYISATVLVATFDRPDDLRNCLKGLVAQVSPRSVEMIVVDNHPASGLTAPVVAEFSNVRLICEPRQGVAYARNAGIIASRGNIVVTIDDDVTLPPDWLEKLIAPFARNDVMAVTGNVLPLELDMHSQQLFEQYGNGGLGRGFERFEVNADWFERSWLHAVPTWELGGTANAAFRASIFDDPDIGLMDEALGPGMPSGVGEDIYLFYKVLKAGHTMVYQASAYVWHKHRREMSALRRQIYNYSKGFISYHLTTLSSDRDFRALVTLMIFLPLYHFKRLLLWLAGQRSYPLSLIRLEIAGNLSGVWSLWQSRQRVRREGHSVPYVPVLQRPGLPPPPIEERTSTLSSR